MTSGDPFGPSGYARLSSSGRLETLTAQQIEKMSESVAYWPDRDHALDHDHCFLCGSVLTVETRSEEHVFPQWLLRDFDLWQERLNLLNGTTIPYAALRIPACKDCNSFWLSQVEEQVATAFRAGSDAVAALDQTLLALWLAKVYYGIHFKEIGLPIDRRDPSGPRILSTAELRRLRELHHIMQALRRRVKITRPLGSVMVFRALVPKEARQRFDYRDARDVAFVAMRVGSTVVLASLLDWGAVSDGMTISSVEAARQLELHPAQFAELAGIVAYGATRFIGEFMYSVHQGDDYEVLEPVLVRDGEDRDASPWAPLSFDDLAEVVAMFMGMPVEDLYDRRQHALWTCLVDGDGNPMTVSLAMLPIDHAIITPLRKAREGIDS